MKNEIATLAGGCFWCTEGIFQRLKGVTKITPGYSGGQRANPTYEQVSTGATGHAEAVQLEYDSDTISFNTLLDVFFATHDPTTLNQQGADHGTQYRSVIFYHSPKQKQIAQQKIGELLNSGHYEKIVTEITPYSNFFPAEDYHQNFYNRNPNSAYCRAVIDPKIQKLIKAFANNVN